MCHGSRSRNWTRQEALGSAEESAWGKRQVAGSRVPAVLGVIVDPQDAYWRHRASSENGVGFPN